MHAAESEILYARSIHGSTPIRVVRVAQGREPAVFEMLAFDGSVAACYSSTRALLTALTGTKNHGWTFDRYFGVPRVEAPAGGSILDMFTVVETPHSAKLTVAPSVGRPKTAQPSVRAITVSPALGIDLDKRGHEVRKILFAGFGTRIMRSGYDPEEVLQEVYRGILARNIGKCPFDVKKSSFGHYVHMVCSCILNNYHRREMRRREMEQVGVAAPVALREEGEGAATGFVDAATLADRVYVSKPTGDLEDAIRSFRLHLHSKSAAGERVDPMADRIVELLVEGVGKREIARQMGLPQSRVNNVITELQEHSADWV